MRSSVVVVPFFVPMSMVAAPGIFRASARMDGMTRVVLRERTCRTPSRIIEVWCCFGVR